jgi:hypothetical protein
MRITRKYLSYAALALIAAPTMLSSGGATAGTLAAPSLVEAFAHPAFQRTWERTDRPVSFGQVQRSWYWGPNPNTGGLLEDYAEGVGGKRLVQYFDKSRMEINNPGGNQNDPFFVTNGLLTVELISGKMQVGNFAYQNRTAANIPLASDTDDPNAPTYVSFQGVSNTTLGDHPAASRVGQFATATINKAGQVGDDPSRANLPGAKIAVFDGTTKHNIPQVVWDFLNLSGPVYNSSNGQNETGRLSDPWFYTTGLPISEPYWAKVKIANQPNVDVMIQAFERRVVTYVPSAPAGFQVQMSNIGQHYYDWRYGGAPTPVPVTPAPTTTPPAQQPTATPTPLQASHVIDEFVGTWLNDDAGTGSVAKLWISKTGNSLKVKWFGACGGSLCDNEEKTAPYTGEPFNITLDGRTFSLTIVGAKLKVVYEGNQNLLFHKVKAEDYSGTWLNDDAATGNVSKLWITGSGGNLKVKWFGACGGSLCYNEEKTMPYTGEPFNVTLDGRTFRITFDNAAGTKLGVIYQGTNTLKMHKVKASDYNGTWVNVEANTNDIVRFEITSSGDTINIHWYGACAPNPCDNGTVSGVFNGEPFLVSDTDPPSRDFIVTFDNAGATRLRVDVRNAPGGDRTNTLKRP